MLRSKHQHFLTNENYAKLAYQQYSIDEIIDTVATANSLAWGLRGRFHDLTLKLFFQGIDNLPDWLLQGLTEDIYNQTKFLILLNLNTFQGCAFPTAKLFSSLIILPLPNEVPLTSLEDWLINTTVLSENEAFNIAKTYFKNSFLESKLCVNVMIIPLEKNLNPEFITPLLEVDIKNINLTLEIAVETIEAYNILPFLEVNVLQT